MGMVLTTMRLNGTPKISAIVISGKMRPVNKKEDPYVHLPAFVRRLPFRMRGAWNFERMENRNGEFPAEYGIFSLDGSAVDPNGDGKDGG